MIGTCRVTPVDPILRGQDGAIIGEEIFRFNGSGKCHVISMATHGIFAEFTLDKSDVLSMHSNAVCFGTAYYEPGDPYPLLYTNVYNNYSKAEGDRHLGTCGVYRILREGDTFTSQLVQVIRVGFTDTPLWRSANVKDVRPYGNFSIDCDTGKLWAFTMRDEDKVTRYFRFALPDPRAGVPDESYGAPVLTLTEDDVETRFDGPYAHYLQGATIYKSRLWSVEGFGGGREPLPRLQVIDLAKCEPVAYVEFDPLGLTVEPEFVSVYHDEIYYSDGYGAMFVLALPEETV